MNTAREIRTSIQSEPWTWKRAGCAFIHTSGLAIIPGLFDADPPTRVMVTRGERFKLWWAIEWWRYTFPPEDVAIKFERRTMNWFQIKNMRAAND